MVSLASTRLTWLSLSSFSSWGLGNGVLGLDATDLVVLKLLLELGLPGCRLIDAGLNLRDLCLRIGNGLSQSSVSILAVAHVLVIHGLLLLSLSAHLRLHLLKHVNNFADWVGCILLRCNSCSCIGLGGSSKSDGNSNLLGDSHCK